MKTYALACLILSLILMIGCGSAPTTHYYVLAPTRSAPPPGTGMMDGLRVGVEPFTVDPPYDRDQLVYRLGTESVEVGFYNYHRWAAPLSDLVAVAMVDGLRGTPGIARIELWSSGSQYDAVLRGRVVYLEEIDLPGSQEARLRLELRLLDSEGGILWSDVVSGSASGQSDTVAQIVELLYAAFDQAVGQTRAGLVEADL